MIKKLILSVMVLSNLFANPTKIVKDNFLETTQQILKTLQNKELSTEDRNSKIIQIITPIFDFKLMAKISLGKFWKQMTKEQQKEFVTLYVQRMKKSYSQKLDKYNNQEIIINNITQPKATRIVLDTSLKGEDLNLPIVYKYHKLKDQQDGKKTWLIYDVVIKGVSIIKTDRAQFRALIQSDGIDNLIKLLKQK